MWLYIYIYMVKKKFWGAHPRTYFFWGDIEGSYRGQNTKTTPEMNVSRPEESISGVFWSLRDHKSDSESNMLF